MMQPKQNTKQSKLSGQALIEYVLILSLAFIGLIAILLVTAPAVGNVFSNTVYNLLGQTTTPQVPMSEDEFWDVVTAVASYTPQAPDLITNTPPPPTLDPSAIPSATATPITPTPTPSITNTPGPSPTPQDKNFPYPFEDPANDPDNFQTDFLDLFASAGPWDASYWDRLPDSGGDCNDGNIFTASNGTTTRDPKATAQVDKIDFPNASLPANNWNNANARPYPGVDTDFCSRFEVDIALNAAAYTFRYKKDDGVRVYIIHQDSTVEKVIDDWNWSPNYNNWMEVNWTSGSAGTKHVRIIHRDGGGGAELAVKLYEAGQTTDSNCTWQLASERVKSPPTSWDDSPFTEYQNDQYCVLRLRGTIDLTAATNPVLEFFNAYELDSTYDRVIVSIAEADTNLWNDRVLHEYETNYAFELETFDLTDFTGSRGTVNYAGKKIELRFVIESDANWQNDDGWWIDDISVKEDYERVFVIGFADDVEGSDYWVANGRWARTDEKRHSGNYAWSDSPGGNYDRSSDASLVLDGRLDLTQGNVNQPEIAFWHSWNLNVGDSIFVELSTDQENWVGLRTGPTDTTNYLEQATTENQYVPESVDIPDTYWGMNRLYIRFRIYADSNWNVSDGWYVDDIEIRNKPIDWIQPTWCDDMEGESNNWVGSGSWAQVSGIAQGGVRSWTDSPSGNYQHGSNTTLELFPYIDLTQPGLVRPILEFYHRWDVDGDSADKLYVEASTDDGDTWETIWSYSSGQYNRPPGFGNSIDVDNYRYNTTLAWQREVIELSPYIGVPADVGDPGLKIRFRLDARTDWDTGDGWYIDTFCLRRALNNTVTLPFADDLEAGEGNWYIGGDWKLATEVARSGLRAFSDSEGRNYTHDTFHIVELRHTLNLSGTTKPTLYYWERFELANDDRIMAHIREVSATGAPIGNWEKLDVTDRYRRTDLGWSRVAVDLRPYIGKYVRIRFELDALHNTSVDDGWWLDSVSIVDRTDEIQYTADPYYEDVEFLAPGEWVLGGDWDVVQAFRNLGSGGSLGPGQWQATWYDGVQNACTNSAQLTTQRNTTAVDEINFNWGSGYPTAGTGLTDGNTFGAIFRRTLVFIQDTEFTFSGRVDDAIRIYDNGVLVFEYRWNSCGDNTFSSTPYNFTPGAHNIEVHFYDNSGGARVELGFSGESSVFHDSPDGDYEHRTSTSVELEGEISLIGLSNPVLFWEHRYDIDSGDSIRVEISVNEGFNWVNIFSQGQSTNWNWTQYYVDLTPYAGQKIVLRFVMDARTNSAVGDGWWIDNVRIIE